MQHILSHFATSLIGKYAICKMENIFNYIYNINCRKPYNHVFIIFTLTQLIKDLVLLHRLSCGWQIDAHLFLNSFVALLCGCSVGFL